MKQKLLVLIAVVFGVLAFIFTHKQIDKAKTDANKGFEKYKILRMINPKTEGETLRQDDFEYCIEKLKTSEERSYVKAGILDETKIVGQILSMTKEPGDFIQWKDFTIYDWTTRGSVNKGLSKHIRKGFRAISIPVDSTSSVTNLIQPDDKVDIIGTFRFPEMKGDRGMDTLTLTILQNVHILATGNNTVGSFGPNQKKRRGYSTVTLALTPKEVEMIVFARQKGKLTLSLRGNNETEINITNTQSVNFKYLEDHIGEYNRARARRSKTYSITP